MNWFKRLKSFLNSPKRTEYAYVWIDATQSRHVLCWGTIAKRREILEEFRNGFEQKGYIAEVTLSWTPQKLKKSK